MSRFATIEEALEDIRAGRMIIAVDDEDRENEGDLVMAAEFVTADDINFMATEARGWICLSLTSQRCDELGLELMTLKNEAPLETAFTVTIEAREGVTTGISAADRAQTIRVAADPEKGRRDIVVPGHVSPLKAKDGGVLERTGHTEASIDLARLAGVTPAGVICEIMNEDGTMARLDDLIPFARRHGLKIGTIADLIEYRSRNESIIESLGKRTMVTPEGPFEAQVFKDRTGGVHLALTVGLSPELLKSDQEVLVRVHEPLSPLDWLDAEGGVHSWRLPQALAQIKQAGAGVVVLLNAVPDQDRLLEQLLSKAPQAGAAQVDLRTYGVGAQILKQLGVHRMRLLGNQRRMPSMVGYGLEVTGFLTADGQSLPPGH